MKLSDLAFGLLVALLGAAIWLAALTFPSMAYFKYGPGFFPGLIGALLMGCGLIMALQGFARRHEEPLLVLTAWTKSHKLVSNLLLVIGCVVFYIFVSDWLGFLITAFIILAAMMLRLWHRPVASLVIAGVATIVTQQAFVELLQVPLPWGVLETWSGVLTWR